MDQRYPIQAWRPYYDIGISWFVIGASCWLTLQVSWWFYPLSFVLIANRILALSLICHEGLHRTLHKEGRWNDFLGRYLCAFPTFISFSKYRRLHLLHHSAIGSNRWDPDRHLYDFYPKQPFTFFATLAARVLTLRTAYDFILYYTEIPELLQRKRLGDGTLLVLSPRSDFFSFALFQAGVFSTAAFSGYFAEFLALYLAPVILLTQPYVMLMGGLQHGPVRSGDTDVSRTISGSKLYMWLLLPLDINYHAEHHLDPSVPHYWLKQRSLDLQKEGHRLWTEPYWAAVRSLFAR